MTWILFGVIVLFIASALLVAAAAYISLVAQAFGDAAKTNLLLERDVMRKQYREEVKQTTERIEQATQIARHFADAEKEARMGWSLESRVEALEAKFDAYARASGIDVDALVADEEAARERGADQAAADEAARAEAAAAAEAAEEESAVPAEEEQPQA